MNSPCLDSPNIFSTSPAVGSITTPIARTTRPSWFDWTLVTKHADVRRFVSLLNARRLLWHEEPDFERLSLNQLFQKANRSWYGVKLGQPDWRLFSHSLAFTAEAKRENLLFHMILNAYLEPLDFESPPASHQSEIVWRRWIDTALDSPHGIEE